MEMSALLNKPAAWAEGNYPLYWMNRMLGEHKRLSGRSGEEMNILPLPGIEARLFTRLARRLISVPTTLSRSSKSFESCCLILS
jgi:hypothetical protein